MCTRLGQACSTDYLHTQCQLVWDNNIQDSMQLLVLFAYLLYICIGRNASIGKMFAKDNVSLHCKVYVHRPPSWACIKR